MKIKIRVILIILFVFPSLVSLAQNRDLIAKIDDYISRWHDADLFHGIILVAEKDQVLYAKGFGYANREWKVPNSPETKIKLGSISKQFTTVMIFQLIEEGKLRLSDKLTDHLPEYRKDTGDKVTIEHLLQQTSGIPCYVRDWTYTEDEEKIEIPGPLRHHFKSNYLISRYMSGDLQFEPGTNYRYSNSNHYLLGKIIERITGKSLEENLNKRILQPLGLINTGLCDFEKIIPNMSTEYLDVPSEDVRASYCYYPNLYGTGAMYSTVEDLYRWNRALETDRLLPKTIHEQLFKPYWDKEEKHSYLFNYFSMRMSGGDREIPYTSFSGGFDGFSTDAFRFPGTGHIVVMYDNSEHNNQWEMIPGIYRILNGGSYETPLPLASRHVSKIALVSGIEAAAKEKENILHNKPDEYDFREIEREISTYVSRYRKYRRMDCAETLSLLNTRLFPYSPDAWNNYGKTLALAGKDSLSKNAYTKAEDIKKLEDDLMAMIAEKKYDDAEEKIKNVRRESPDRTIFTPSRIGPLFGKAFSSQMYDHALNICRLWMLGNHQVAGPYYSMALIYLKTGKTDDAAACYRKVIELFPNQSAEAAKKELENLEKK